MSNPIHFINALTVTLGIKRPPSPKLLPLMDCDHCQYKQWADGGHCYMFRDKPDGDRCGQFKRKGSLS